MLKLIRSLLGQLSGGAKTPSSSESAQQVPPLQPVAANIPEGAGPNGKVPSWLTPQLPLNAVFDSELRAQLDALLESLPSSLTKLTWELSRLSSEQSYDPLVQRANRIIWLLRFPLLRSEDGNVRHALAAYAKAHFPPEGQRFVFRWLAKDPNYSVRKLVRFALEQSMLEVALPASQEADWDASGWRQGLRQQSDRAPRSGTQIQRKSGVPAIRNVGELRQLLRIRSSRQLGFLLLATEKSGGPYRRFSIAKRNGGERVICAPGPALRWVQRRILDEILNKVSPHSAAHGFICGRSTVSNASPHIGASLILKFDLQDFFPSIHGYRVMGLFSSLGYEQDRGRFSTDDESAAISPCLARLCCYTPNPQEFGLGWVPQGAPTSPALTNLICRGLDARLYGLAEKQGGVYTRYADDLTFSFRSNDLPVGRFRWWVNQICQQEGFHVHEGKFRVLRPAQRQVVTGLVVNQTLRVPRTFRRRLRAILHNCRLYGIESQIQRRPGLAAWLRGQASYLHMVHPEEGQAVLAEIDALFPQ